MIKIDVKYTLNEKKLAEKFERRKMAAQKYVNTSVVNLSRQFVPMREGALDGSVIYGEATNFEQVIYNTAYAKYLYEGKGMVGKSPKTVTDKNLVYDKSRHKEATSKWFEAMKKVHWDTILEGAKKQFDNA